MNNTNITNAKLTHPCPGAQFNTIELEIDGVWWGVPEVPDNAHYQQYLKWLEEGNEPLSPDPIPEPETLTPQQKLEAAGLSIEELKELLGL